ncbi:hypothetical protein F7725_012387 [Dissostichus mawsoni]|uniref:Uncharacterized protein n=1 Tax=Dissostichus mawsoni TaxID=36200 RepID=A0A7J5YMK1_DISMA|nr:hypothetical protein F7725_012387 [Dissostichus mawsoni]
MNIKCAAVHLLSPSLRSVPEAPSATPEDPEAEASSARGPDRLSMLLAADRQEGVEAGEMTEAETTVQCGLALLVFHGGVGSVSQQQRAELRSALLRRLVERRESPFICSVHTRVVLDEEGGDVHMLRGREATEDKT